MQKMLICFLSISFVAPSLAEDLDIQEQASQVAEIIDTVNVDYKGKELMSAASIATTATGASQLMQGLSEKNSDKNAVAQIDAYVATFKCQISGADKGIAYNASYQIPEMSQGFMELKSDYVELAQEIKSVKQYMGLESGAKSQEMSKPDGLYEYAQNDVHENQMSTAAQRLESGASDEKIKSGAITSAAGVALGVVSALDIKLTNGQGASQNEDIGVSDYDSSAGEYAETPVVEDERTEEEVAEDNINEICEEFPDEPECQ